MTTTAMLDKTADHPEIWLEPKSDDYDSEGRMWCQDNQWGTEGVRYVLAPLSHAAGDVAGLCELIEKYAVPCWAHDLQQMPRDVIRQHFREFANEVSAAISARAEAAEAGSDEAIMQERESCAFAVECHSGFGDPATIEACAQIIRDRSDPSLRSDSVHLTPERYADLLAAEARVNELEAALEPFAKLADELFRIEDGREMNASKRDDAGVWGFDRVTITYGDFRAARSLSPIKEAGK